MARDPRGRIDMKLHGVTLLVGRVEAPRAGAIPNPIYPGTVVSMTASLCETCAFMREVDTPKGSRFLLCRLSQTDPAFPKYPPQPVVRCLGFQSNELRR